MKKKIDSELRFRVLGLRDEKIKNKNKSSVFLRFFSYGAWSHGWGFLEHFTVFTPKSYYIFYFVSTDMVHWELNFFFFCISGEGLCLSLDTFRTVENILNIPGSTISHTTLDFSSFGYIYSSCLWMYFLFSYAVKLW